MKKFIRKLKKFFVKIQINNYLSVFAWFIFIVFLTSIVYYIIESLEEGYVFIFCCLFILIIPLVKLLKLSKKK